MRQRVIIRLAGRDRRLSSTLDVEREPEPSFVPFTHMPFVSRALRAVALGLACLSVSPALARRALPPETTQVPILRPAESLEGNFLAAYIAGAARDTTAAATFYREALKEDSRNPELLERAFVSFLADGSMQEAFRAAERLAQRDSANGLAHLALGVRELKVRQYAKAREHLNKGGPGRAADLTSTLLTAWALAGAGDGKRALETADKLKGERTYNVFRDYHAGLIADMTGNQAEAERRLKAAYDGDKTTLRVVDAFGRFEARHGRPDSALAVYKAYEDLAPRQPVVRDALESLRAGKTPPPLVG